MPLLCGSTTPSVSIIAIAASVALPPLRNISCPACAARGSAAETVALSATGVRASSGVGARAVVARRASGARAADRRNVMARTLGVAGRAATLSISIIMSHRTDQPSLPTSSAIVRTPSRVISAFSPALMRRASQGPS